MQGVIHAIIRAMVAPVLQHYAKRKRLILWLYVVLWYAVMTFISHIPGSSSSATAQWFSADGLIDWNIVFRFSAHCGVFGLLAMLCYGAIQHDVRWSTRSWSLAVACTALGGLIDEVHQGYVPGRFFKWSDVALDTIAGAVAIICLCRAIRYASRITVQN
jgi:VanZ family protein